MDWIEIPKNDFFKTVGSLDVHPHIPAGSKYPYTAIWKLRDGQPVGKSVDQGNSKTKFYIIKG